MPRSQPERHQAAKKTPSGLPEADRGGGITFWKVTVLGFRI